MIIVKLLGGLGNQMFQYSAGKALALHHQTDLLLDTTELEADTNGAYTKRNYELSCFNIKARIALKEEIIYFFPKGRNVVKRILNRLIPNLSKKTVFYESGHYFDPRFFELPKDTYLSGFWQSEKYFKNFHKQIEADFIPSASLPIDLLPLKERIERKGTVSIHVRRGDYVTLSSANDFHGTCNADYYQKAVEFISKKEKIIEVFIFSDDVQWCKSNLSFECPVFFMEHSHPAFWDMYLMSLCNHNVIANSSFSWWGAWLNTHKNKIVIAPEYWLKNKKSVSMDIIAQGWKII